MNKYQTYYLIVNDRVLTCFNNTRIEDSEFKNWIDLYRYNKLTISESYVLSINKENMKRTNTRLEL